MKTFKNILFMIMNILTIPLASILTCGIIWYSLPSIQSTIIGEKISSIFTPQAIFWSTISCAILYLIFRVLDLILNKQFSSKLKNFFTHTNSWIMCVLAMILTVMTFVLAKVEIKAFELTTTRKIEIGVCFVLLLITFLCGQKISKIINRRIQSYETSKEMNVVGRGSIIFTNILKLLEILFPEVILLALIAFCLSINVALYFIIILIAFTLPMFGNIECDLIIRKEIKRNQEKEDKKVVQNIANVIKGE